MADLLDQDDIYPPLAKKRFRYLAAAIDYLIVMGFFTFLAYSFGVRYYDANGTLHMKPDEMQTLYGILFWLLIMPIAEGWTGQTIGKMICGLKVVASDYSKTSIGRSIVRHLFDCIDYLPFFGIVGLLVASNTKFNRRVGDLVAQTIVVEK